MPSTCEFQLNNPNAVYNSGDSVSGAIILNTNAPKDVTDIRIIFRGEGNVSWTETEKHRYNNHTVHYKANELYIDKTTTVRGEGTLPAGTHTYTFQILLPLSCPTSGDGRYGRIHYELMLKIHRPCRFDNEFRKPLTVLKLLDLNLNPTFRIPIESEDIFSSGSCCYSNGTVNTTLSIPFGDYAIGQSVKYLLHIQNQSIDYIDGYTIEFNRKIIFTARTPYRKACEDNTTLYKKSYDNRCLRFTTRIFNGNFLIVSTPPTTEGDCIISVRYSLKVILNMVGCTTDNTMSIPIYIGTVPLRERMVMAVPTENDRLITVIPTAPELPLPDQRGNDLPPNYQDLGPPSFEEATRSSSPFINTN